MDPRLCAVCLKDMDDPIHDVPNTPPIEWGDLHEWKRIEITDNTVRNMKGMLMFAGGVVTFFLALWLLRSNGLI